LGAIKAKAYVMPGQWGHFAGGPGTNPDDVKFLDNALKELLRS
jgi:homoserine O-acetyltransferase/O-succinyltransferase